MSLIRIADRDRVRPLHVVLIVLVLAVVAGGCLLTSAGEPEILPDGAVAWQPDSLLWAVVQLLNLRASQPTPDGVAVKSLILCLGAAIAAVAVAIAVASGPRRGEEVCDTDTVVEERPPETVGGSAVPVAWQQIPPLTAAWVFAVLYVLWSFASVTWSKPGRDIALAGSALLAMHYLWTFALGLGLTRATARYAGHVVLVTTVAVAILAVLYWRERNPNLRASYPIGNPTTLAACLIPGLILALVSLGWASGSLLQGRSGLAGRSSDLVSLGSALVAASLVGITATSAFGLGIGSVVIAMVVCGLGMGLAASSTSVLTLELAPPQDHAQASSALQLADVLGSTIGISLASAVYAATVGLALAGGEGAFTLIWAMTTVFALVAAVAGWRTRRPVCQLARR